MAVQKCPWRRPAGERYAPPPHLPCAQVEPGGSGTTVRCNLSRGPHPPASGAAPGQPMQHSPPQSADVRRTQEQQQQQPEAGGHRRQHRDRSTAGRCGQGARLRGQPVGAGARASGRARRRRRRPGGDGSGGGGGAHLGRGGRGGGGERTGQPAPVSPAELAREKKSELGAGVGGERGRGGGGGQGGRGGGSCDSQAAGLSGGSRAPRGGRRRARRKAGARARGGARARSWLRDPPASPPHLASPGMGAPRRRAESGARRGGKVGWSGVKGEGRGAEEWGTGWRGDV